jgi:hypothetical protein
MAQLPRGIAPDILVSQVINTMPYLFDSHEGEELEGKYPPVKIVREFAARTHVSPAQTFLAEASHARVSRGHTSNVHTSLTHLEYFKLCLSSHYLTVATPVPTDVDNQIRQKLWPKQLPLDVALEMASLVLSSHDYDFALVTNRFAYGAQGSPYEKEIVHGHLGEWFTVACGAYCAMKQYDSPDACLKREEIYEAISKEVNRHSEIFGSLWRAQDGLGALKASAALAHNFGDLDRVMDMWELSVDDPLRLNFYKLGVMPFDSNRKLRYLGRLWTAGELYKSVIDGSSMALENHRHYALRKPRCLRKRPAFMISTGPFFDDWGRAVARGLVSPDGKPTDETIEVMETLKDGWDRQPKSLGYGRGLRGMFEVHPELPKEGLKRSQELKTILNTPQDRFEKRWNDEALRHLDDIPSRAG